MPELPEVEVTRRKMEAWGLGQRIARLHCHPDPIVYENLSAHRYEQALAGAQILGVHRRGKQIFWELDRSPWPLFHLGMSGEVLLGRDGEEPTPALRLRRPPRVTPRSLKLEISLENGGRLLFVDPRRFGRLRLRRDPLGESPLAALGPDAFDALPSPRALAELLAPRKLSLKGFLLDQSLLAGIGNWVADEVIYQARLDPRCPAQDLIEPQVRALHRTLKRVLSRAVNCDADAARFPRTWLFHHRWGKVDGARTAKGEPIEFLTVAGRTTAWVRREAP